MERSKNGFNLITINVEEKENAAFNYFSQILQLLDSFKVDHWIEYGTLLGAVREKTIIPWDSEFDIGIWYEDYQDIKEDFISKCSALGFNVNLNSTDRIKLLHRDTNIGAYTIDLHTYHKKGNIAYVSFDQVEPSIFNALLKKLHKAFHIHDNRSETIYMMGDLIKAIMAYQEIPIKFLFKTGRYNYQRSFKLVLENLEIDNDKIYLNQIGLLGRLTLKIISFIPHKIHHIIHDYLAEKVSNLNITNDIQAIPAYYFENLTQIKFRNLVVPCPRDYIKYVELVYGKEWNKRKPNWDRTQNAINDKLK